MFKPHSTMRALLTLAFVGLPVAAHAGATIPIGDDHSITVGAGFRTAFTSRENASPAGTDDSTTFDIESVRLYVGGSIHEKVKFTFNTECMDCVFGQAADEAGAGGDIDVLDAIVQFELSPEFNIWMGRMLTPADRIEMNGPYYGLTWNQYTVPLLPSDQLGDAGLLGRDDGITVWGTIGKFQYATGLFDGVDGGPNQEDNLLWSTRLAYNFLNMEGNPAYYTSSTYFGGAGDVFTVGLSFQSQDSGAGTAANPVDFEALIVDVLFEKVLGDDGGVFTFEGEYKTFDTPLSAAALADPSCFCLFDGDAFFATVAYQLPADFGMGRLQPYLRVTSNEPGFAGVGDSDLTEIGFNYVINAHNLRLNFNYTDGDANLTGNPGADVSAISIGMQIQI